MSVKPSVLVLLVLILLIFAVWYLNKKGVTLSLWGVTSCIGTQSSKSSIKAESVLLVTEVFPDEKKRSLVGVAGGVAKHKEGTGPVEALEFFFDTTTPILND